MRLTSLILIYGGSLKRYNSVGADRSAIMVIYFNIYLTKNSACPPMYTAATRKCRSSRIKDNRYRIADCLSMISLPLKALNIIKLLNKNLTTTVIE